MYLLSSVYGEVYISKPQTSRYANSERYIICKNFLFNNLDTKNFKEVLKEIIDLKEVSTTNKLKFMC